METHCEYLFHSISLNFLSNDWQGCPKTPSSVEFFISFPPDEDRRNTKKLLELDSSAKL